MIEAVTTRDFRKNFKKYADSVAELGETYIVARPENKNVVLISQKEYNSWQETNYLLQNKANRDALAHSISQWGDNEHLLTPDEFEEQATND